MFLPSKLVATPIRYVQNGPEDRPPSFKANVGPTVKGSILRYSTATDMPKPAGQVKHSAAVAALKAIAKAAN